MNVIPDRTQSDDSGFVWFVWFAGTCYGINLAGSSRTRYRAAPPFPVSPRKPESCQTFKFLGR